jgi:hypothetical protein
MTQSLSFCIFLRPDLKGTVGEPDILYMLIRMGPSGMLRRVALVRIEVSEELSASFIRVTRIGELGTTLAVTSNRRSLRRNTKEVLNSP